MSDSSRLREPNYSELILRLFKLDKSVRFACVVNKLGYIVAHKYREGLQPLMTYDETRRNALLAAIRHSTRLDWEYKMGKTLYSITRYERVTRATIPMQDKYLLLISFDEEVNTVDSLIQKKIMPLVKDQ
ncbi:MAG: hypothetical protein MN733_28960 [Nitrososphaera sp.]|nr:hypothetical protein [Nitrososphaera sp.]